MTQQYRAPVENRPMDHSHPSPSRHRALPNRPPPLTTTSSAHRAVSNAPMLSASSSNNHSLLDFGRSGGTTQPTGQASTSLDFLPSVSFDDLQTSIESASTEFTLTQFPSPTGTRSILESEGMTDSKVHDRPYGAQPLASAPRPPISVPPGRPGRSASIKRPGTAGRQPSVSSVHSGSSAQPDASIIPAVTRGGRRQSHYPPVSNTINPKPPRKSIAAGITPDLTESLTVNAKRRPSMAAERDPGDFSRTSLDSTLVGGSDGLRYMDSTRAAKAKSVQPPTRIAQSNLLPNDSFVPESSRLSVLASHSPGGITGRGSTPSSANKRASMKPGSNHAHGLGARTISPTDTRRAKRMSTMPTSQSLNHIVNVPPPPPVSLDTRAESRSPSMIPRKTSGTPSSARTTPDINRKSYSSSLSVTSNLSFNTVRTSVGSSQPRVSQSSSASRLPAPKHAASHNPPSSEETEEVPPVPAIPKAYESPKGSPADIAVLERKKSGLSSLDTRSIQSSSAASMSTPVHMESSKIQRKPSARKSPFKRPIGAEVEKPTTPSQRKNLQPLSLPPINLGPLNIPNVGKEPYHPDSSEIVENSSPPPSRMLPKTPTTPMTASRSAFFSKSRYDDTIEMPSLRSSSTVHRTHHLTPTPDASSIDSSLAIKESDHKPSISPFLSSSAPKGGFEHAFLKRSTTVGDDSNMTAPILGDHLQHKPAGPRALKTEKPAAKSPTPGPSDEPATPSSMSSLRRKLSLTWKRGSSKNNGGNAAADTAEQPAMPQHQPHQQFHPPARQDSMPPPRIPVSATVSNLSSTKQASPSPPVKQNGGYLESRRRKSSAASLGTYVSHDRTKSETWGGKKDTPDSSTMPATRNGSVMHKFLKPKGSSSGMRGLDSWNAELDKDDVAAEDEMKKMGSRRKETEIAARTIDALRKRATPKERVGPHEAIRIATLNIYERGEIIDYQDVYFCGTQNAHKVVGDLQSDTPNFGYDDERGDYTIVPGDHLSYRYEIVDILGKGSFGQVVRCIDHKLGVLVAVKIIRNKKRFHQQALVEVNILQKLREWDPHNKHSMVNFTQSFYFRGHLCISTELLDMNLYEFIKLHQFKGFSLRIIRRFTKQILSSLTILKQKKVIHCDLKPENILLRHPLHAEIKVIDFGSSCFENEKVYTYIQSRFYRSPEVILGMTYGMPIDMWSVGCILAELLTGVPIFPGENEQEQLACIMEVFGPPEKHLIEKSTRKKLFFDSMGKPRLTVSSKGRRRRPSSKTLQQVLKCEDEAFLDFIARCLRWDPDRRLRPEDAVRHEFITGKKMPPAPQRMPTRDASPVKRHNTISVPRPLPEPPGAVAKPPISNRTGPSPHKAAAGTSRRASGATAPTTASTLKRTSTSNSMGGISAGTSGLPRAAGRSASGKQDLAAAGATAAMSRRG